MPRARQVQSASGETHDIQPLSPAAAVFPLVDHQLGVFEWVVKAYEGRIDRHGIIDSPADPAVAKAVSATGRRQLITAGIGTEVCEVAPALHTRRDGYQEAFVPMRAARRSRSATTSRCGA